VRPTHLEQQEAQAQYDQQRGQPSRGLAHALLVPGEGRGEDDREQQRTHSRPAEEEIQRDSPVPVRTCLDEVGEARIHGCPPLGR
jgi:hypothetical protein